MKIQQIRSATVRIEYAGKTFLTDPWLIAKGAMGTFEGKGFRYCKPEQGKIAMPMCDLPMAVADVLKGVDCYLLTHVHPDHIDMEKDGTVGKFLDKKVPVFVQSPEDAMTMLNSGFEDVTALYENSAFQGIDLIKTPGRHGTKIPCGPSCGIVLRAPCEKTLYIAGDTIWYDAVAKSIRKFHPDVIILNACAAEFIDQGRLIMDDADVENVYHAAPKANIMVSHMDNVAHASLTRQSMRQRLTERGIFNKVWMPEDGESRSF